MTTLISVAKFREEVRAKRKPTAGVFRVSLEGPADVEGEPRTKRFCFSDQTVDRMGDTIAAAGWDLADFTRNPVALWAHDSFSPPIGRASSVTIEGKRLMGNIEFVPAETYAFADTIYRLVDGRFINAVSVGFLPTKYSFVENDPDRGWGIDFEEQTLLEISLCPIPANPNALGEARSKGIDTRPLVEWAERTLDGADVELGRVLVTRKELNRLRKAAKEPPMARRTTRAEDDDKPDDDKNKATGNCGRDPDEACGMKDPNECSVHAGKAADPEKPEDDDQDEKRLRRLLLRLLGPRRRAEGDEPADHDEAPLAHEDAIRMAHKSLRTSKAFMTEAVSQHSKAMVHLQGVVDALDVDGSDKPEDEAEEPDGDEGDPAAAKAAQLRRAADLKARLRPN